MTIQDLFDNLRYYYSMYQVCHLSPTDRLDYKQEYVLKMIDEFERKLPIVHMGMDSFTELEKLGVTLLLSAAGLTMDVIKNEQ